MPTLPTLTPESQTSKSILTSTGSISEVAALLPYGVYSDSETFLAGASDQVAYTFKKLGGDVLDIEIKAGNVYAAYEEAVLEYSYVVNLHQAKNSLGDLLGNATASFNEDGEIITGPVNASLKLPRFSFQASQRIADGLSTQAGLNGDVTEYSASFSLSENLQDYDLQAMASGAMSDGSMTIDSGDSLDNKRITVTKVYYVAPRAQWRFFNYYGGMNVIGNLSTYGQYSDESTFEVVPTWQNKAQVMKIQYIQEFLTIHMKSIIIK